MTSLATIAEEAKRLTGRLPEPRRHRLQQALVDLCARHWEELRGPAPTTPLARALWAIPPPAADLAADLAAGQDGRLTAAAEGESEAQVFALLALWAMEHADAEGVRAAHAPMMLFESERAGRQYATQVGRLLRRELEPPTLHPHAAIAPLERALGLIAAATGRCDPAAVAETLRLLSDRNVADPTLEALRRQLAEAGVEFLPAENGEILFRQHGRLHRIARHRLAERLGALRAAWLGVPG